MVNRISFSSLLVVLFLSFGCKPEIQKYIVIDQFGYRPKDNKVAVIADPQIGYNATDSFTPGERYQVIRLYDKKVVFEGKPTLWNEGKTSLQSGDRGWWFDFSEVTDTGNFYILDKEKNMRSYTFRIDPDIYKELLNAAQRVFYYQRIGIEKQEKFAGIEYTDGIAIPMDSVARDLYDRSNLKKVKDLRGGWMDAGDYNKYVTFAFEAVNQLLTAYELNPKAFTDDNNIPESGNGIPDILDEVKWELDWIKRMQDTIDGGVLLKMGHLRGAKTFSPPSTDTATRYYYPQKSTAASIATSGMFSHAALVFSKFPKLKPYAEDMQKRAVKAWEFYTNTKSDSIIDDGTIQAGLADWDINTQKSRGIVAAVYLYELTGDNKYDTYLINTYMKSRHMLDTEWGLYETSEDYALIDYIRLPNANKIVVEHIIARKKDITGLNENKWFLWNDTLDLYRSYVPDAQYHWGSCIPKTNLGNAFMEYAIYDFVPELKKIQTNHALDALHYFHGVNPNDIVYLTNTKKLGADSCTMKIYHYWFMPGTQWETPPPCYMPGGANKNYSANEERLKNQPPQKSYLDYNTGWPANSWEITEPGIYYQAAYIMLLSHFVNSDF